jgi:beta-lactamase class D
MKGILMVVLAIAVGCRGEPPPPQPSPTPATPAPSPAPSPTPAPPPSPVALADSKVDLAARIPNGCFTIRQRSTGTTLVSDPARCALPRSPFSTFKIANALIAIDAGVLAGPDAALPIDEALRSKNDLPAWAGAHTLRSGMKVSAVPHFRTLATHVGADRMKAGLARLGYGNQAMTPSLDRFWLDGGLRISASEQLDLVDKLSAGGLPVAPAAQAAVREVLRLDEQGGAVLYGKTGSGTMKSAGGHWVLWLVGWVERGGETYPFATWLEIDGGDMDTVRVERTRVVRGILAELGLIAAPPA